MSEVGGEEELEGVIARALYMGQGHITFSTARHFYFVIEKRSELRQSQHGASLQV